MKSMFIRLLVLAFVLWLPLQSGLVAAMPVCGDRAGDEMAALGHAHAQAHPDAQHDAHHDTDRDPQAGAGDATSPECNQCAVCHTMCMGVLPLATISWSHADGDTKRASLHTSPYGFISTLLDRPPLARAG